jgi:FtsH-binding integral membrane protein
MLESLFDLSLWITGPAIIVALCLFAVVGLLFVRRRVLPRLRVDASDSEFTGAMLQSIMVFYGLAVALIAVSVWQTYSDTSKVVSEEATALAALYRDVSSYPDSVRPQLQNELREYTRYVIEEAWPLQRRGKVPAGGVERMNRFQATLVSFEPITESQKLLHGETLHAYNGMIKARRLRLDAVNTGLPGVMWAVIVLGAFIGLSASFFFRVEDPRLQGTQVLLLATFIGLIIFMILALDRPFRGDLGVSADPYQLIYDQLMKP